METQGARLLQINFGGTVTVHLMRRYQVKNISTESVIAHQLPFYQLLIGGNKLKWESLSVEIFLNCERPPLLIKLVIITLQQLFQLIKISRGSASLFLFGSNN